MHLKTQFNRFWLRNYTKTRSLLLARGPSGLLTCPSRPSGAQAKGHTHRTLTIYDALTMDDAMLFGDGPTDGRTDKAILGVGLWFYWDAMRQAMLVIVYTIVYSQCKMRVSLGLSARRARKTSQEARRASS